MENERRLFPLELRVAEGDTPKITGYAAVFNRDSEDLGGFVESIDPSAFNETIADDIRALVDHDPSRILGRSSAGTLRLSVDDFGLAMEIDLPDTSIGRDIRESIRRGDITGASFSFRTIEDDWNTKDGKPHRLLKRARVYDVGPVTFPAYPDTSVAVRSLDKFMRSKCPSISMFANRQRQAQARGR